ncbi:hypothetical protein ACIHJG_09310 [Streptomyces sp. NPDC052415]|uniref:hypothetical protein n=1 Tax=Streptomyces sp. NPDC052415 TaxID=3365690 RepID=UPI0037D149AC
MDLRGRKLKFAAVTTMVVLALSGFSSGRGTGGSGGDGDSGGGCSSSGQDHDSSSSRQDDDYDGSGSGGSGSGSAELAQDSTVELVSCATEADPYAVVEVTNPNGVSDRVTVVVHFLDDRSAVVDLRTVEQVVPANETVSVQVDLPDAAVAARVDHCEADLMPGTSG